MPQVPLSVSALRYTFVLCFVVLNVATLSGKHLTNGGKASQIYGLAIGFCIVVGGSRGGEAAGEVSWAPGQLPRFSECM